MHKSHKVSRCNICEVKIKIYKFFLIMQIWTVATVVMTIYCLYVHDSTRNCHQKPIHKIFNIYDKTYQKPVCLSAMRPRLIAGRAGRSDASRRARQSRCVTSPLTRYNFYTLAFTYPTAAAASSTRPPRRLLSRISSYPGSTPSFRTRRSRRVLEETLRLLEEIRSENRFHGMTHP